MKPVRLGAVVAVVAVGWLTLGAGAVKPRAVMVMPAEFEPQDKLIISWDHTDPELYVDLVAAAAREVTVVIAVAHAEFEAIRGQLADARVPLHRVRFVDAPVGSLWMRDFGPLSRRDANGRVSLLDAGYPYDASNDAVPQAVSRALTGHPARSVPLIVEGGNLLSDGAGTCLVSDQAIANSYFSYPLHAVKRVMRAALGCKQLHVLRSIPGEPTGHVDMFVTLAARRVAVVSQAAPGESKATAAALDAAAQSLRGIGFKVHRIPMPRIRGGVFRSYTNVLVLNNTVLVPRYPADSALESRAHAVLRTAFPGRRLVPLDVSDLIRQQGALHCIGMNVPK